MHMKEERLLMCCAGAFTNELFDVDFMQFSCSGGEYI